MKKFNKGIVITSTVAAALAALTLTGCAGTEIAPKAAPAVNANAVQAVQVVKNDEVAQPVKAEAAEENTAETTAAKKDSKKKSKKKKSKKSAEKTAETAQQTVQPIVVVPTVQVQPVQVQPAQTQPTQQTQQVQPAAQPQQTAAVPANTQAPADPVHTDVYPVWVEGDVYAGSYYEATAGRGMMDITRNSDGTYSVEVNWASSAAEKNIWNFTGEFNGRGLMNYTNCRKTNATYDANGNMTCYTVYSAGSGYIEFKDEGVLEWHDDMGDILPGTTFVSKIAYNTTNTKANEVATAGSNYVEEKTVTELPTGWFYDGNGSGTVMNIAKNGNNYSFVVSYPDERGTCYHTYSFSGKLEDGKVSYVGGQQDDLVYNADSSVKSAKFVSNDHKGQVRLSNTGIVWEDSYGPHFVFISKAM